MNVAKQYHPSRKVEKEPSWVLVVVLSGILSGLLLFTIGWYLTLTEHQRAAVFKKIETVTDIFPGIVGLSQPKVLLVMGVDMPPRGSKDDYKMVRTDTMMLVKLDTNENKVNIVSVPRDSKVYLASSQRVDKINAAFTYGGPEESVQTVENTFGVNIDNYLVINIRGVKEVVDALDGIDVYIEKPLNYEDHSAGLYIHLQPGKHHLDGRQAEGFLRFRHDAYGDIGRIRRQQQFISAVAQRLKDPAILLKVKPLLDAGNKYLMTDMSTQNLIQLALFGKDLSRSSFEVATLPGHPSLRSDISYWVIDPAEAEAVLNRMIIGNASSSGESDAVERSSVGILYTASHNTDISDYRARLQTIGFNVRCQQRVSRSGTKLVTHHSQPQVFERRLKQSSPILKDAQLIFSPHGTTFETNSCGQTDFTVILGDDTRSAVQP